MTQLPTLYKKTQTAATQKWTIWVDDLADGTSVIRTLYGQVGGRMQPAEVAVRSGKNIGRSNATTPQQQARLECEARWKKQKDKGYVESADAGETAAAIEKRPMLAQDYAKRKDKVKFPCHVQPKLDGIRCLAHAGQGRVALFSRMGKPIETVPHVNAALAGLMGDGEVWDGELYIHGERFQVITSLVKKAQPGSERVQYHVYDAVAPGRFEDRYLPVAERIAGAASPAVLPVGTLVVHTHEEIKARHDEFVAAGYEGAMVRHNGCPYEDNRRSPNLLKNKSFLDQEFEVVGVGQGKGKFEGLAVFTLKTAEGAEFEAVPRGTEAERRAYFEQGDDLVGKQATVRFFEWTSSTPPLPRFPVLIGIREDY